MECWTIENFAPLATIIAAFIGGGWLMFVHWLNMLRTAKAEFRSSVFNVLEGVYPIRTNWNDDVAIALRIGQPKLQRTISIYRYHLCTERIAEYDKAWDDYSKFYRSVSDRSITDHNVLANLSKESGNHTNESDPYEKLCIHVDKLLSFAK